MKIGQAQDLPLHGFGGKNMAYDITLKLREDLIKTGAIVLEADDYAETEQEYSEPYDDKTYMKGTVLLTIPLCIFQHHSSAFYSTFTYPAELTVNVHSKTGEILIIVLDLFKDYIKEAVQSLRDNPLPWTFSVPSMKIREKPLEDVLLAIYKKHKKA